MFEKGLFEAAAWIAVARLNYAKFAANNSMLMSEGRFGTREIDANWAELGRTW